MTAARSPGRTGYRQPAFWTVVVLLAGAWWFQTALTNRAGGLVHKVPLPPQRSLTELDLRALRPFVCTASATIDDPELLERLGTSEYCQWLLRDTESPAGDPAASVLLFVTYYPLPDRVPHVPEECYLGSGYQPLRAERVTLSWSESDRWRHLEAKWLRFGRTDGAAWESAAEIPVLYFFRVNGRYAASRSEARLLLNQNLLGASSYFSKVELVFNRGRGTVTRQAALATARKLLAVLLPLLEKEYWPASLDPVKETESASPSARPGGRNDIRSADGAGPPGRS